MFTSSNKTLIALLISGIITGSACKKDNAANNKTQTITELKKTFVTTIAGSDFSEFEDGPISSAKFSAPKGIAVGADGALYVADTYNSRIRKIANGQVITLAGDGTQEIRDGAGANAHFSRPAKIVLGPEGNFFITDESDYRIRLMTPSGVVKFYAGKDYGYTNGDTSVARFDMNGVRVAFNETGDMFVPDTYNYMIRKISSTGKVSTYAGTGILGTKNGALDEAQFNQPTLAVIDKQGNLYVSEKGSSLIRKITKDGQVSILSGSGIAGFVDGQASKAQFSLIRDMVSDDKGNLYILDESALRRVYPNGDVVTVAGSPVDGYKDGRGDSARFSTPRGLAIDQQGNIYVADTYNYRIRKVAFQ